MEADSSQHSTLVLELSRELVADLSPDELELFNEVGKIYVSDSDPSQPKKPNHDDLLGFGPGTQVEIWTPAILAAVQAVVTYIGKQLLDIGKEETLGAFKKKLRKVLAGESTETQTLTKKQLETIWHKAYAEGIRMGMKPEKAEILANSLVGVLVIESPKSGRRHGR